MAGYEVSFKSNTYGIQEVFTIGLMMVLIFAVLYSDMELAYKIGIGALVFSIIFLASIAGQMLKQMKENERRHS